MAISLHVLLLVLSIAFVQPSTSLPRLMFSDGSNIRILQRINGSINDETVVVSGYESGYLTFAFDFDYQEKIVFWTRTGFQSRSSKIQSAPLIDNKIGKPRDVINLGLVWNLEGLAVDWVSKKFYWTNAHFNRIHSRIEVANYDGSLRKVLIWRDLSYPSNIAVDPMSGYMFWIERGKSPKIERANMDGSNRIVIASESVTSPLDLTIDHQRQTIYWTDESSENIVCTNFDGDLLRRVVRSSRSTALSLFGKKLYFFVNGKVSLHACNKKTGKREHELADLIYMTDLHVFEPGRQRKLPSTRRQCGKNNGGCSHLCLLSPKGYSCACPSGVRLLSNKKTCDPAGPIPLDFKCILLVSRDGIRRISPVNPCQTDAENVFLLSEYKDHVEVAIDVDPVQKYIYWSNYNKIKRARINGTGTEDIVESPEQRSRINGLAVDWIARKLYWTDGFKGAVEVSNLNGSDRRVVITQGWRELWPSTIVVEPEKGYIFWTSYVNFDWGTATIRRTDLDGNNTMVLVNTSVKWPNGLAIDYTNQIIYWADGKLHKIEAMDFDGKNRRVIVDKNLDRVFGLTVLGDNLYWTDSQLWNVGVYNIRTGKVRKIVVENGIALMEIKAINSYMHAR